MKKFVSIILAVFMTCAVFAQKWSMSYDEILKVVTEKDITRNSEAIDYSTFDFDKNLQNFAVGVWYSYFPEYASQYGVPFICSYANLDIDDYGACAYHHENKELTYACIIIIDSDVHKWATYFRNHLSVDDKRTMSLLLCELTRVAEYLDGFYTNDETPTWNHFANKFQEEYQITIRD